MSRSAFADTPDKHGFRQAQTVDLPPPLARRLVGAVVERLVRVSRNRRGRRTSPDPVRCRCRTGSDRPAQEEVPRGVGCRPSSPSRAAISTWKFGQRRASRTTRSRSSAAHPTWAPMNAVRGCRTTIASSPSMSSSNGGKPSASGRPRGRVGQKCQSGLGVELLVALVVSSSGSKNAIGSATWMVTGTPSSPAAAQSGSRRGSSTATSRPSDPAPGGPASSRPSDRGARGRRRRADAPPRSRRTRVGRPRCSRGRQTRRRGPGRDPATARSRCRSALAPAAVEVDERLDTGLIQHAGQLLAVRPNQLAAERLGPRWSCASIGREARPRRRRCRGTQRLRPRLEVGERRSVAVRAHPFRPVIAMPRTKYCWATTNRMIIGSRLTRAPAIISGHLPTNWPWKNASPTVVVYWSRWRR